MKKRVIAMLFACTIALSLVACGGTKDNTPVETVVEETNEIEEVEESIEEVVEAEIVEEPKDTRLEDGIAKVYKVIDAYKDILLNDHELDLSLQNDVEKVLADTFYLEGYDFANGDDFHDGYAIFATLIAYYDNYVNKDSGYYSIAEWISKQPDEITVKNMYLSGEYESTNDIMMYEAISVAKFLSECENITGKELIETTEYVISDMQSSYAIPLDCDGKEGLTAVYDAEGNLLNIRTPDDWEYTYTVE